MLHCYHYALKVCHSGRNSLCYCIFLRTIVYRVLCYYFEHFNHINIHTDLITLILVPEVSFPKFGKHFLNLEYNTAQLYWNFTALNIEKVQCT